MDNKINKKASLMKLYKTRKQLQNLPDFILQDIGLTRAETTEELNKSNLFNLTVSHLRYLLKGG